MNKTLTIVIVVAVIILVGAFAWYMISNNTVNQMTDGTNTTQNTQNNGSGNTTQSAKGTMYFAITDAAADMKNVTAVNMTIDSVQAYNKVDGWVTISQASQTFNLLDLKAKHQAVLLAKATVSANTYNEFKFHIAKVMVTANGQTKQATLPSGNFNVKTDLIVNANSTSAVQLDVLADKSMHVTSSGEYVFAPTVTFDSRVKANVAVGTNNVISIANGETNASVHAGMDIDGTVKTDFVLDANTKLNVTGGVIKVGL